MLLEMLPETGCRDMQVQVDPLYVEFLLFQEALFLSVLVHRLCLVFSMPFLVYLTPHQTSRILVAHLDSPILHYTGRKRRHFLLA